MIGPKQTIRNSCQIKQVKDDWSQLSSLITNINNDPTQQYKLPQLKSLNNGVPELNFQLTANEPHWGSDGGSPFQDVTYKSVLNQTRISRIVILGGLWVDQIEVTYIDGNGRETKYQHGGGGTPGTPLNLQPHEYITMISGTAGGYVNQLKFETNLKQVFVWPPSPQEAAPFSCTIGKNQVLIGFQGRSGHFLDWMYFLIRTFLPATWRENHLNGATKHPKSFRLC